jgi:Holliday junction resolvase-like predicted endonuclease
MRELPSPRKVRQETDEENNENNSDDERREELKAKKQIKKERSAKIYMAQHRSVSPNHKSDFINELLI